MKTSDQIQKGFPTEKVAELKKAKTTLKTSLAHLPPSKQQELGIIKDIIIKRVPAQMIILFGSYARGNYVEQDFTQEDGTTYGYASDFDILVVSKRRIDPVDSRWREIEDVIASKPLLTQTTLINHDLFFLNAKIKHNHYFYVDIIKEGIMLYDTGKHELAVPEPLTSEKRLKKAKRYVEHWMGKGDKLFKGFKFYLDEQDYNEAVFLLHQAAESYYAAFILVLTDYKPKTHDLEALYKEAISIHEAHREIFPIGTKEEKRLFQLLRKAYVSARYDADYKITPEELAYLAERVSLLRELVKQLCEEEIAKIKSMQETDEKQLN